MSLVQSYQASLPVPAVQVLTAREVALPAGWQHVLYDPFWRLYWNRDQGGKLTWEGQTIAMRPGLALLVAPYTRALMQCDEVVHHVYCHFTLTAPCDRPAPGIYPCLDEPTMTAALAQIVALATSPEANECDEALALAALLGQALAELPPGTFAPPVADPRLQRVVAYMEHHLADKLPNARLAELAAMERSAFVRLFSTTLGVPPQGELARRRIARACMLLHDPRHSLDAIAEQTGFCDRFHLSRVFKRLRGTSPARFRRQWTHAPTKGR